LLVGALAIIVIVGSFLLRPGTPESAVDDNRPDAGSEATPTETPAPKARRKKPRQVTAGPEAGMDGQFPGLGTPPGLGGSGRTDSLPAHRLTIRLSSPNPIGWTGYIIPTSTEHPRGSAMVSGGSWSLTTTVYGRPDYGVVFLQAGADGRPATCTITVDGRVTERRSTRGPYGTVWCQG
jgi:hypothetical protein